ncbi:MAG: ABC transporter ATP-binding protein/permease [Clostridia bacterium]|nr:ABC transporter ATP-binding protein/permease [Clostridia bacterium]
MLALKNITKAYDAGDARVEALRGVDLAFPACQFAAILGPSGCGKTTLLNIIGGLDHYTSGDLVIRGRSTKSYKDHDWDTYRNHSIGFVFQSYNLIPHQTVLRNVELALTLSGVSKAECRRRATEALEKVGLGDQLKKKPNQMSGGQMQRVAIARALVNDPDILLADEPTGALDSETSVQVMEILKEISKEKLVIMVTHNPDLADAYANRIIRLLDGKVISDTNPHTAQSTEDTGKKKQKKPSMSFFTALSLSLNNLMTKKGRTILTAFAGSIGIIGIALILSLSSGVNAYIERVERDTLSSYPLMIEKQTVDMTGMMETMMGAMEEGADHELDKVYTGQVMTKLMSGMMSQVEENDLKGLKAYLEENEEIEGLVSGIQYEYATPLTIYRVLENGAAVQVNPSTTFESAGFGDMMSMSASNDMMSASMRQMDAFQPIIDNDEMLESQFDLIAGRMPEKYDEVVLIVNERNELSDFTLYTLGLKDQKELQGQMARLMAGEAIESENLTFTYDEMLSLTFRLMVNTDYYALENGVWVDKRSDAAFVQSILENAPEIRVVGILRPAEDAVATSLTGGIGYLPDLMGFLLDEVNNSEIVKAQLADETVDVFTGLKFATTDEAQPAMSQQDMQAMMAALPADQQAMLAQLPPDQAMQMMAQYMPAPSTATLEDNLTALGVASEDDPSSIYLYPIDFEAKEDIEEIIAAYNKTLPEERQIRYTDYVGLMMSSVTTIVNAISYILIAFVAISLVVSSIMIGIITYISVLERTKEIGILRAIGASKRDISRVFNAETLIVGFTAGAIGIGVTLLLNILVNHIIFTLTTIPNAAGLPMAAGLILVGISMLLTFIAGLIPSRLAAKKDPVVALRTE